MNETTIPHWKTKFPAADVPDWFEKNCNDESSTYWDDCPRFEYIGVCPALFAPYGFGIYVGGEGKRFRIHKLRSPNTQGYHKGKLLLETDDLDAVIHFVETQWLDSPVTR